MWTTILTIFIIWIYFIGFKSHIVNPRPKIKAPQIVYRTEIEEIGNIVGIRYITIPTIFVSIEVVALTLPIMSSEQNVNNFPSNLALVIEKSPPIMA